MGTYKKENPESPRANQASRSRIIALALLQRKGYRLGPFFVFKRSLQNCRGVVATPRRTIRTVFVVALAGRVSDYNLIPLRRRVVYHPNSLLRPSHANFATTSRES